jgi:uncharacterized protein (TIGR03083 family)
VCFPILAVVGQTEQMDTSYRHERVRVDGERLIDVAASNLSAAVPSCPEWTNTELLTHMVRVWHMLALFAEHQPQGFPDRELFPAKPEPGEEVAAARVALQHALEAFAALPTGVEMWSWAQTQSSDYFHRRIHLETLVHRIDAEQAAGLASEIDPEEAADAVDERFVEFLPLREGRPAGSLHVHRTDGAGEWTMQVRDDSIVVACDHAKGDAAARGSATELMLAVWGRAGLEQLETFGDSALIEEWFALTR